MKFFLIFVAVLLVLGAVGGWFLIHERNTVLQTSLAGAGLSRSEVHDVEVELNHGVFEVEFESAAGEYRCLIDPVSKQILNLSVD